MIFLIYFLLFIAGVVGGFYGSSVGGGAFFTLPILLFIGLPTHLAMGTQRFAATILEFFSAWKFHREKKLHFQHGLLLALIASIGAILGAHISLALEERYLNLIIAVVFLSVFLLFFLKDKKIIRIEKKSDQAPKSIIWLGISTFCFGMYGGLLGAGFGTLMVMLLSFFGFVFMESAALARMIGFFMSLIATLIFAQYGAIHYEYGLFLGAGFAVGSWIGIGFAVKRGDGYVKNLLFVVVLLTVVKLLLDFLEIKFF